MVGSELLGWVVLAQESVGKILGKLLNVSVNLWERERWNYFAQKSCIPLHQDDPESLEQVPDELVFFLP
jgi:hypothetical protein